jgi:hypothetical protein
MFDCSNLLHPFQNDPGVSQRQRIVDALVDDSAQIDGRTLADLLNYFSELSTGVNYYDAQLRVSDWRSFFGRSLPFLLASISRADAVGLMEKCQYYNKLFTRTPTAGGLQLLLYFINYNVFNKLYQWHERLDGSNVPLEVFIDELIRTKLATHLKTFIVFANTASKCFGVRKIDFTKFVNGNGGAWDLTLPAIYRVEGNCDDKPTTPCEKLKALYESVSALFPALLEALKTIPVQAMASIKSAMLPEEAELQKNHPPHLALMFAFISLFQKMQGELNKKKRDHLRYFYMDVLHIKPVNARADRAFVVFELQKLLDDQFEKFQISKGTALSTGRDTKNADVIFETDNEIVVNETRIAQLKTVFLDNKSVNDQTFVRGVFMAPDATMANGVDKPFVADPKNWFTVGGKLSKYTEPGKKQPKPYPHGRLGFVLASPVLYLAEGDRTVTITVACLLETNAGDTYPCTNEDFPNKLLNPADLYADVKAMISKGYHIISEDLLQVALNRGVPKATVSSLRALLPTLPVKQCNPNKPILKRAESTVIDSSAWTIFLATVLDAAVKVILGEIFVERHAFRVCLSGKEGWIEPSSLTVAMPSVALSANQFTLQMVATLTPDQPAVTFFDKEALKEDLDSTLPLVKIELDDEIKLAHTFTGTDGCCLLTAQDIRQEVSFYHFFRHVRIIPKAGSETTRIDVKVCGLKNFVVQNDDNVMDVNGVIYPFGTRPKLGANFYVSAKEIFCKNWSDFDLRFNWKDKPAITLDNYYHGYEDRLTGITSADFAENRFVVRYSLLEGGTWFPNPEPAFPSPPPAAPLPATNGLPPFHLLFHSDTGAICTQGTFNQFYKFTRGNFSLNNYVPGDRSCFSSEIFRNDSRNGFLRLTLLNQDFQHARYSFVLTRQMLALGKFPDVYVGPVYDGVNPPGNVTLPVMSFDELFKAIDDAYVISRSARPRLKALMDAIRSEYVTQGSAVPFVVTMDDTLSKASMGNPYPGANIPATTVIPNNQLPPIFTNADIDKIIAFLDDPILKDIKVKIDTAREVRVVIPLEPYTPQIEGISLNYNASAAIDDIDLIHLYPFANTSKQEQITLQPMLFPTLCDEGTLYIGLKDFQPGSNLNLLFQLAEATADSETDTEPVHWYYLDNNLWKELRKGFEVIKDGTQNLTTSGIIQLALPENMTQDNAVMPKQLFWIKAAVAKNSRSVCETTGVFTQAVSATFKIGSANDLLRMASPLESGRIEKLQVAQPSIKAVTQPYESFDGAVPEIESAFPLRVSERLRHKGRAIQKWDYERIVLQEFPMIFKAKCINHSFKTEAWKYDNDVPYAPGYVILAVLPDMKILKAGNAFEPRVPVSMLEKIESHIARRVSPFVRFKAANPRYEKVSFCITVRLVLGADKSYYEEKLKLDLSQFMAPWSIGRYEKFSFGECVVRSDVLQFLEQTDYVDFVLDLRMAHEKENAFTDAPKICPVSPRSILVAGDIHVTIDDPVCDAWCEDMPEKACENTTPFVDYCNDKPNG